MGGQTPSSRKISGFFLILHMFVFLNMRFGCRSLMLGHVGALLGLSWEDLGLLGATLGPPWGNVAPRLAISGELGSYFDQP